MSAARSFTLDADQAREGDGGLRLDTTGLYIGTFTEVKLTKNDKGTEGVEMTFKAESGAEARYLSLYTHDNTGKEIYGYKQFMALMACMSVREANPAKGVGKEFVDGKLKDVQIDILPELQNKPIGLVLQKELYTKNAGGDGERMAMVAFCNAESRKTASEILDKKDATAIDSMLKTIAEVRDNRRDLAGQAGNSSAPAANEEKSAADFDDDIPF